MEEVKNQYKKLPYPPRNKDDLIISTDIFEILEENGLTIPEDGFKIAVLGCGTGDSVLCLALQCKLYGLKNYVIDAYDLSKESLDICKERLIHFDCLENVNLLEENILEIKKTSYYDYVNSIGVLHHLPDPVIGLQKVQVILKPEGIAQIMLYASIGRTGVYHLQSIFKLLQTQQMEDEQSLELVKDVLKNLPQSNWFNHSKDWFKDQKEYGDAGIYDMFLHSQDQAFSVLGVYKLCDRVGLTLNNFIPAYIYNIDEYAEYSTDNPRVNQQLAELFAGNIVKHNFICSKRDKLEPAGDVITPIIPNKEMEKMFNNSKKDEKTTLEFINYLGHKFKIDVTIKEGDAEKYFDYVAGADVDEEPEILTKFKLYNMFFRSSGKYDHKIIAEKYQNPNKS